MSIEKIIEEHTKALQENTVALVALTNLIGSKLQAPASAATPAEPPVEKAAPEVKEPPVTKTEPKPETKKTEAKKPAAKSEPKPEAKTEVKEPEKDMAWYEANVMPVFTKLADKTPDFSSLKELLVEYGVSRGRDIPPQYWEEALEKAKTKLAGYEAQSLV